MSDALQALYEGDLETARKRLPADDELSVFEASAFGRCERLRAILSEDPVQAAARSGDGFTPLHLAVFARQEAAARLVIEHGADVNALSSGEIARVPPLRTAAHARSVSMARLLLDAGADVNGEGEDGFTTLHAAAFNGDEALIRLLLDRGANPGVKDPQGRTAADLVKDDNLRSLLDP